MKILLVAVNAKYIHSNLAVYSLKASAGLYETSVELAEYTINHQTDEIFRSIYQKKPQLLFFSCYIWNRRVILETAENIRRVLPDTVIWAGGPEVSYDAEEFLRENPQFDGVMKGEGERTFYRLLDYYCSLKGTLSQIPGIAYREKETGAVRVTGPGEILKTLDELPFVYDHPEKFQNRIIYYESSRGCPFSCSYCLSSIDKRVRFRSTEKVKQELLFFLKHRVPQVKFVDRTFNCSHSRAEELWQFIRDHDNGVTNFHFEIAADILTDKEVEILSGMRPGLVQLEIGVQTVNERTLAAIHRTAEFEKIASRVNQIAASENIHQHLDLIAGLPYEDFESFQSSFDTVYRLHPQELQLGFLKVLRGSEMHRRAEEYGIVYRSECPYEVLKTKWISCDELIRLKEVEEMLEVYYNSQQFRNTMAALEQIFGRPFELYASLADYYKKNELDGKSYSRMQRFSILREFIRRPLQERSLTDQENRFDELLTFDFYLRENGKSRPDWAPELISYQTEMAAFYREEEQTRTYLPAYENMTWKQMMRMTHLERFTSDVLGNGSSGTQWLLFDYRVRNPLTGDAAVCKADLPY